MWALFGQFNILLVLLSIFFVFLYISYHFIIFIFPTIAAARGDLFEAAIFSKISLFVENSSFYKKCWYFFLKPIWVEAPDFGICLKCSELSWKIWLTLQIAPMQLPCKPLVQIHNPRDCNMLVRVPKAIGHSQQVAYKVAWTAKASAITWHIDSFNAKSPETSRPTSSLQHSHDKNDRE